MKGTKIAIIIIASVMVTVGTTLTLILQQQQQVNAASLRHPIENSIIQSAGADHRSQHSNQENLCYKGKICRQSNVDQGTLGNDNSVTGFADQSTTNTTTNAATSGPAGPDAGAKGDPGPPGPAGVKGDQGPIGTAGSPRRLVVTQHVTEFVPIAAGSAKSIIASCDVSLGEAVTGGGYQLAPIETPPTIIFNGSPLDGSNSSWQVDAFNPGSGTASVSAIAQCARLVP
jgi:type II secretory pathway pseudopilin PulG